MKCVAQQSIRVLIADDHAVVRQGLRSILSNTTDIIVSEEAETGQQVLDKVRETSIDVVVMDMEMPGKTGWDVLLELQHTHPRLPVLILSIYPEDQFGPRFLKAGAAGYLSKTSTPEQLVNAIRTVMQGGRFVSANLAERLVSSLKHSTPNPAHERLSDREFQVFRMIASGKPTKTIADELCISTTTVSTHRARILEKMNFTTNSELVIYANKHGLVM